MQVFCPWSSFRISACTVPRTLVSASARSSVRFRRVRGSAFALDECLLLLVDGDIQEHRQYDRRGAVDGHGNRCVRVAKIESVIQHPQVIQGGNRDSGIADLAVNVRPLIRVTTVQGHRIEGSGQSFGAGMFRQLLEPAPGFECVPFSCEHPGRGFAVTLEWKDPCGKREPAGQIVQHHPSGKFSLIVEFRQGDPGDGRA